MECQNNSLTMMKSTDTTYMLLFSRKRYFVSEYTPIDSNIAFSVNASDKGRHIGTGDKGFRSCWPESFVSSTGDTFVLCEAVC